MEIFVLLAAWFVDGKDLVLSVGSSITGRMEITFIHGAQIMNTDSALARLLMKKKNQATVLISLFSFFLFLIFKQNSSLDMKQKKPKGWRSNLSGQY